MSRVQVTGQHFAPKFKELFEALCILEKMNCIVHQVLPAPKSCIYCLGTLVNVKEKPGAAVRAHPTTGPAVGTLPVPFLEYLVHLVI